MTEPFASLETLSALDPAQAAGWWAERMQSDEDHAGDDVLFQQWLAASEANRSAWQRVCAAWAVFDEAADSIGLSAGLQDLRAEALAFRPRRAVPRWMPAALAASIALVVGGVFAVYHGLPGGFAPSQSQPARLQMIAYSTRIGQTSKITLQDGTRLTLDTGSEVDVGFTGTARLARLVHGQAFFEVAHDAAHPFRVAFADRVITVHGTKFNMRLMDGVAEVLLVQGSIGVSRGSDPAVTPGAELERLTPGQAMVARNDAPADAPDLVMPGDPQTALLWRDGMLRFDNTTIGEAATALNRYSSDRLVIDDPAIAAMRIGGTFRTDDCAGFARIAAQLHGLRVKRLEGHDIALTR